MSSSESDDELAYDPFSTVPKEQQIKEYRDNREEQRRDFKKIRITSEEDLKADLNRYGIETKQQKVERHDATILEDLREARTRIFNDIGNMNSADKMGSYMFEYGSEIDDWEELLKRKFYKHVVKGMFGLKKENAEVAQSIMKNVQETVREKLFDLVNAGLHPYFPIKVCGSFCTPALLIPYEVMSNQFFKEQVYALLTDERLFAHRIVPYMQRSGTIDASIWTVKIDALGKDVDWKTHAPVRSSADTDAISGMVFTVPQREGATDTEYFSGTIVEKDVEVLAVELDKTSLKRLTKPAKNMQYMSSAERILFLAKPLEERRPICKNSAYIDLSCKLTQTDDSATGFREDFLEIEREQLTPNWRPNHERIHFNNHNRLLDLFGKLIAPYGEKAIGEDVAEYHTFCIYDERKSARRGTTVVAKKRINVIAGSYDFSAIFPQRLSSSMNYTFRRGDREIKKRLMQSINAEETFLYDYAMYRQQQPANFAVEEPKPLSFDPLFNICILRAFLIAIFIVAADNNVGGSLG